MVENRNRRYAVINIISTGTEVPDELKRLEPVEDTPVIVYLALYDNGEKREYIRILNPWNLSHDEISEYADSIARDVVYEISNVFPELDENALRSLAEQIKYTIEETVDEKGREPQVFVVDGERRLVIDVYSKRAIPFEKLDKLDECLGDPHCFEELRKLYREYIANRVKSTEIVVKTMHDAWCRMQPCFETVIGHELNRIAVMYSPAQAEDIARQVAWLASWFGTNVSGVFKVDYVSVGPLRAVISVEPVEALWTNIDVAGDEMYRMCGRYGMPRSCIYATFGLYARALCYLKGDKLACFGTDNENDYVDGTLFIDDETYREIMEFGDDMIYAWSRLGIIRPRSEIGRSVINRERFERVFCFSYGGAYICFPEFSPMNHYVVTSDGLRFLESLAAEVRRAETGGGEIIVMTLPKDNLPTALELASRAEEHGRGTRRIPA